VGQIFVATPYSFVEFQEQVRTIPEGYVEFYMHDDSLDLFIPEDQATLLQRYGLGFASSKCSIARRSAWCSNTFRRPWLTWPIV